MLKEGGKVGSGVAGVFFSRTLWNENAFKDFLWVSDNKRRIINVYCCFIFIFETTIANRKWFSTLVELWAYSLVLMNEGYYIKADSILAFISSLHSGGPIVWSTPVEEY